MLSSQSRRPLLNRKRAVQQEPLRKSLLRWEPPTFPLEQQTAPCPRVGIRVAAGLTRSESSVAWAEKPTDLYLRRVWKSKQWWNQVSLNSGGTPEVMRRTDAFCVCCIKSRDFERLRLILSLASRLISLVWLCFSHSGCVLFQITSS